MHKRYNFTPESAVAARLTLSVEAPKGIWERMFANIEKFSEANGFSTYIRRIKKDVDLVLVDLWREDVSIGGGNIVRVDQFLLQFHFDPNKGGSMAVVEELVPSLEKELLAVEGVSVAVKRDDG